MSVIRPSKKLFRGSGFKLAPHNARDAPGLSLGPAWCATSARHFSIPGAEANGEMLTVLLTRLNQSYREDSQSQIAPVIGLPECRRSCRRIRLDDEIRPCILVIGKRHQHRFHRIHPALGHEHSVYREACGLAGAQRVCDHLEIGAPASRATEDDLCGRRTCPAPLWLRRMPAEAQKSVSFSCGDRDAVSPDRRNLRRKFTVVSYKLALRLARKLTLQSEGMETDTREKGRAEADNRKPSRLRPRVEDAATEELARLIHRSRGEKFAADTRPILDPTPGPLVLGVKAARIGETTGTC